MTTRLHYGEWIRMVLGMSVNMLSPAKQHRLLAIHLLFRQRIVHRFAFGSLQIANTMRMRQKSAEHISSRKQPSLPASPREPMASLACLILNPLCRSRVRPHRHSTSHLQVSEYFSHSLRPWLICPGKTHSFATGIPRFLA